MSEKTYVIPNIDELAEGMEFFNHVQYEAKKRGLNLSGDVPALAYNFVAQIFDISGECPEGYEPVTVFMRKPTND